VAARLAGEDFWTGLEGHRADAAGQQLTPVPGLASSTAAGPARRITAAQWLAVETGMAMVTGRIVALLPPGRAAALTGGPVTIDLDATGRRKVQCSRTCRLHLVASFEVGDRGTKVGALESELVCN